MLKIFKRELKSFFTTWRGYAFIGIFALITVAVRMVYHYFFIQELVFITHDAAYGTVYSLSAFEYMLSYLPIAAAFSLPVLTFSMLERERREGAYGLLRALPINARDMYFGKTLAALFLFVAAFLVTLTVSFALGFFASTELLTLFISSLTYILIGAALLAINVFFASVIKNKYIALAAGCFTALAFAVLAYFRYFLPTALWDYAGLLSVISTYMPSLLGNIDLTALLLQLSVFVIFMYLGYIFVKREFDGVEGRADKGRLTAVISAVSALGIVLNIFAGLLPYGFTHFDVTEAGEYTVSDEAEEFLSSVKEETTVYVLDANGSNPKFEYFMKSIDEISDNVNVVFASSDNKEIAAYIEELGVGELQKTYGLLMVGSARKTFGEFASTMSYYSSNSTFTSLFSSDSIDAYSYNYYVSYYYELLYGDSASSNRSSSDITSWEKLYNVLRNDTELRFCGSEYICQMVEYVNIEALPQRYILSGHGELDISDTELYLLMQGEMSKYNVEFKTLDMSASGEMPKDATSITVFKPSSDISREEADMFIEFLNGGGQMTFITSPENLKHENLMSVMSAYGLEAREGIVGEKITTNIEATETEPKREEITYTTDIGVYVNTAENSVLSVLYGKSISPVLTCANEIVFNNEVSSRLILTPVLTVDNAYVGDNKDELASRSVAASAEDKKSGAKLLWYTSADDYAHIKLTDEERENDTEKVSSVNSKLACIVYSLYWIPFSYESAVPTMTAAYFDSSLMTVTSTSFMLFPIAVLSLAVFLIFFGVILCDIRKKK